MRWGSRWRLALVVVFAVGGCIRLGYQAQPASGTDVGPRDASQAVAADEPVNDRSAPEQDVGDTGAHDTGAVDPTDGPRPEPDAPADSAPPADMYIPPDGLVPWETAPQNDPCRNKGNWFCMQSSASCSSTCSSPNMGIYNVKCSLADGTCTCTVGGVPVNVCPLPAGGSGTCVSWCFHEFGCCFP